MFYKCRCRDIVVRLVAEAQDPATTLADLCSHTLVTVRPTDSIEEAVRLMRTKPRQNLVYTIGYFSQLIQSTQSLKYQSLYVLDEGRLTIHICNGDFGELCMRTHAIRRLPVVDGGQAVGMVSLGDLAVERDPHSALGEISAAPPNA